VYVIKQTILFLEKGRLQPVIEINPQDRQSKVLNSKNEDVFSLEDERLR
jgi:DNA-binding XRE family transcriptional regulator